MYLWNKNALQRPSVWKLWPWPWLITLNLVPIERSCHRYIHVKYEGFKSYQSKDMANVKVFLQTNKQKTWQTDGATTICPNLTTWKRKPFENLVGKGENAGNQCFLLFPHVFSPSQKQILNFHEHLFCLQMLSIWTSLKICCLVKT